MTVFSRVVINPHHRSVIRICGSRERLHAVIARATNSDDRREGRTLWRLDQGKHGFKPRLYIVSSSTPQISVFQEELGIKPSDMSSCDYGQFLQRLECEQQWCFRLTANPTRTKPSDGFKTRGHRFPLHSREEREQWLFKKMRQIGCHMTINRLEQPEVMITGDEIVSFSKPNRSPKSRPVELSLATFDGILAVDNPNLLRRALIEGIGPAKAYGCGLLTLAPPTVRAEVI